MFCKNCGKQMENNARFCPECGARQDVVENEKPFWQHTWFAILMLFVCFPVGLYLFARYHGKIGCAIVLIFFGVPALLVLLTTLETKSQDDKLNKLVTQNLQSSIPSQKAFNEILIKYQEAYRTANTDLKKADVDKKYKSKLENFLSDGVIKNWYAVVERIEPSTDGKYASVVLRYDSSGVQYVIKTDYMYGGEKTLIPAGTDLYKAASDLHSQDIVMFSGILVKSEFEDSFFSRLNYRNYQPDFKAKFTSLKKIE